MKLALIAAMDKQRAIGHANRLPWHLPDDLAFFKRCTQGGVVVMGRKTFESIGSRPLPNRRNLVLTRQANWRHENIEVAHDWHQLYYKLEQEQLKKVWIIGGAEIYATCIAQATELVLTQVETQLALADAWFPQWSAEDWRLVASEPHPADDRHAFAFTWQWWERIGFN